MLTQPHSVGRGLKRNPYRSAGSSLLRKLWQETRWSTAIGWVSGMTVGVFWRMQWYPDDLPLRPIYFGTPVIGTSLTNGGSWLTDKQRYKGYHLPRQFGDEGRNVFHYGFTWRPASRIIGSHFAVSCSMNCPNAAADVSRGSNPSRRRHDVPILHRRDGCNPAR